MFVYYGVIKIICFAFHKSKNLMLNFLNYHII